MSIFADRDECIVLDVFAFRARFCLHNVSKEQTCKSLVAELAKDFFKHPFRNKHKETSKSVQMKFGVVLFPGSNCEQDTVYAFQTIMEQEVVPIWHKDSSLPHVDGIVIPGGFSFADALRPGALACMSPVMEAIIAFAKNGGLVFGIGNGFQILCEAGLLPGALLPNKNGAFTCQNTYIIPDARQTHLTHYLNAGKVLKIPIAHGFGRYFADSNTLADMRQRGQILFRYCDENGEISQAANPNGSAENIAGICNETKNVYGMMPHPERAVDDELGNTDGCTILKSIVLMGRG